MKKARLWFIRIVFVLAFFAMAFRMYSLQIHNNSYYSQKAQAQQGARLADEMQVRKPIYFTDKFNNKIPIVLNKEFPIIYASPKKIINNEETADKLSGIIDIEKEELLEKFSNKRSLYSLLVTKATKEQVEEIKKLDLEGIYTRNESFRYYPYGALASHVLGFVSPTNYGGFEGQYGLEKKFNEWLLGRGTENMPSYLEDEEGLYLTIDRNIQSESEKILNDLVSRYKAEGGSIIVQDPSSGKIITMASSPSFDPNNYSEYPIENFINPAVEYVYEPGSVFKVLTMVAGIDSGAITKNTTYYDTGIVKINGREIRNWDLKGHGTQTMMNVIEKSLNTGAVFAEQQTGHKTFTEYIEKFGFGVRTDIFLPGEVSGNINPLYNGRDVNYATASFGQGVSVTPIQLVSSISAIANGGFLLKPLILENQKKQIITKVMKENTSKDVTEMMVSDVDKNILGKISNYKVAGKSGTAYVPDFENGGYSDDVINTFTGFAPATNPKFVILIKLDKPEGAPLAGQTVVPAFKKLASFILNYYDVAPDRINN